MVRRSTHSALAAVAIAAFSGKARAQDAVPTSTEISGAVQEVLARDHYDLETSQELSWNLLRPIAEFLHGFSRALGGIPLPLTYILFGVLTLILFGLLAHILYSFYASMGGSKPLVYREAVKTPVDPKSLANEALLLAEHGMHADACRKLYEAALATLEEKREGHVRLALTNSEYLKTFHTDQVVSNLKVFADLIDWKWYGDIGFDQQDFTSCHHAYDRLLRGLQKG